MVDRYRPTVTDVKATAYCGPHPDGEYVKIADYDALAAEYAEFKKAATEAADWGLDRNARLAEAERLLDEILNAVPFYPLTNLRDRVEDFLRPTHSASTGESESL